MSPLLEMRESTTEEVSEFRERRVGNKGGAKVFEEENQFVGDVLSQLDASKSGQITLVYMGGGMQEGRREITRRAKKYFGVRLSTNCIVEERSNKGFLLIRREPDNS